MDFDNHKGHGHSFPCSVGCEICDVAEPVDGDPWMLKRFLEAQDDKGTLQQALVELRATKSTDWIWFVFPQIWGLATNPTRCSSRFALRPGGEAYEYAHHPELLSRLTQACNALLQNERPLGATVSSVRQISSDHIVFGTWVHAVARRICKARMPCEFIVLSCLPERRE